MADEIKVIEKKNGRVKYHVLRNGKVIGSGDVEEKNAPEAPKENK